MQPIDPQILVVADDLGLVVGEDPPVASRHDELGIDDVVDAAEDGPLAGLRPRPQVRAGLAINARMAAGVVACASAGSSPPSAASNDC